MAQAGQAGQNVAPLGTIFRGRAGQGHGRADGGFWGHPTDAVGVLGHRHRSQGGPAPAARFSLGFRVLRFRVVRPE